MHGRRPAQARRVCRGRPRRPAHGTGGGALANRQQEPRAGGPQVAAGGRGGRREARVAAAAAALGEAGERSVAGADGRDREWEAGWTWAEGE